MAVNKIIIGKVVGENGAQGATGPQGPAGPQGKGFRYRGEWVSNTQYVNSDTVQDVVLYEGSAYVCLQTHQRTATPDQDTTYWGLLASKGQTGDITNLYYNDTSTAVTATATNNYVMTFANANITSVNITLPSDFGRGDFCSIHFKSSSSTTFSVTNNSSYTAKMYMYGFETQSYTPSPNTDVAILITCDGLKTRIFILEE